MRILFGNWKYLFKNLWYVLPFALVPAIFLALSLDYAAISSFMHGFFAGDPRAEFLRFFRVFSLIRIDHMVGALYSVLAIVCIAVFTAAILALVEKHMRIGKRTMGGVGEQFKNLLLPAFGVTLLFVVVYEIWAIVVAALWFAVSAIDVTAVVYLGEIIVFLAFSAALLFLITAFLLWLPCMQITSFRPYNALLYSYRLAAEVRGKLFAVFCIFFGGANVLLVCCALAPEFVFRIVAFAIYFLLFPAFCVRMETVYFETDRLDREDVIRSYREL